MSEFSSRLLSAGTINVSGMVTGNKGIMVPSVTTANRPTGMTGLKIAMRLAGFDCGPHRLPLKTPSPGIVEEMRNRLEAAGFFNWTSPSNEEIK